VDTEIGGLNKAREGRKGKRGEDIGSKYFSTVGKRREGIGSKYFPTTIGNRKRTLFNLNLKNESIDKVEI
jgi:hypothetical protein